MNSTETNPPVTSTLLQAAHEEAEQDRQRWVAQIKPAIRQALLKAFSVGNTQTYIRLSQFGPEFPSDAYRLKGLVQALGEECEFREITFLLGDYVHDYGTGSSTGHHTVQLLWGRRAVLHRWFQKLKLVLLMMMTAAVLWVGYVAWHRFTH